MFYITWAFITALLVIFQKIIKPTDLFSEFFRNQTKRKHLSSHSKHFQFLCSYKFKCSGNSVCVCVCFIKDKISQNYLCEQDRIICHYENKTLPFCNILGFPYIPCSVKDWAEVCSQREVHVRIFGVLCLGKSQSS